MNILDGNNKKILIKLNYAYNLKQHLLNQASLKLKEKIQDEIRLAENLMKYTRNYAGFDG